MKKPPPKVVQKIREAALEIERARIRRLVAADGIKKERKRRGWE